MRIAFRSAMLLCLGLLGACGSSVTCDEPQVYQASAEGQRIVAPDGLDDLEEGKELRIPEASPQAPRPEGSPCLERPPNYASPNQ